MALSTPDSDQRGFRETSPGLRAVIICVISIALMLADSRSQLMVDIRRVISAAAYPIQVVIDSPITLGHWLSDSFSTRSQLREENVSLSEQILIQNGRLQRMNAVEQENARLRALMDSTAKVADRVLIGEIMSVDMNPFRHRIVVSKGSNDEAFIGQALIDADGIVGQITRNNVFSAEAILITDLEHALPVEILRNRLRSIAVGTGQLNELSLPFLPRNADVVPGDQLVTSGLGGTFPPGYPVGTITEVISENSETFLAVSARPAAHLNRVREVLLIWPETRPESEMAPDQADSEAEAETNEINEP